MGTRNEKLKSTPTFFPLSFVFPHVATLLNLTQNQCSHITISFFLFLRITKITNFEF